MSSSFNPSRLAFLLLGASLALGFTVAADKLAKGLVQSRRSPGIVSVKGLATRPVSSDIASVSGRIAGSAPTLAGAAAGCAEVRARVTEFFGARGVIAGELVFAPVTSSAVYRRDKDGRPTSELEYHVVSQRFTITKKDPAAIRTLADAAGELLAQGIDVDMSRPVYLVSDLESAKRGLLEEATKNARERAATLVAGSGAGSELGRLASISQGVFTVKAANSSDDDSDYNTFDRSSPEKEVRLVVSAEFEVVKSAE